MRIQWRLLHGSEDFGWDECSEVGRSGRVMLDDDLPAYRRLSGSDPNRRASTQNSWTGHTAHKGLLTAGQQEPAISMIARWACLAAAPNPIIRAMASLPSDMRFLRSTSSPLNFAAT